MKFTASYDRLISCLLTQDCWQLAEKNLTRLTTLAHVNGGDQFLEVYLNWLSKAHSNPTRDELKLHAMQFPKGTDITDALACSVSDATNLGLELSAAEEAAQKQYRMDGYSLAHGLTNRTVGGGVSQPQLDREMKKKFGPDQSKWNYEEYAEDWLTDYLRKNPFRQREVTEESESISAEQLAAAFPSPQTFIYKYPELSFPMEAMAPGLLKELTEDACTGGLSPGLVVPALLTLISSLPGHTKQEGVRVNQYCCLLALVGAGKDTAIDRAVEALGLDREFTAYSPSGERSLSNLIGDKPASKNHPAVDGFRRHCIVTYELGDTLAKARGQTSSVLEALQWLYDHDRKIFSDSQSSRVTQVDCRLSWLTALPVGDEEIDTDVFKAAFGEKTSHGLVSRFIFGFAEARFDRRKSRNWQAKTRRETTEQTQVVEGLGEIPTTTSVTLANRYFTHKVQGMAPGVEEQYLAWKPERDRTGRDTYHVLKLAVLIAIANLHQQVEQKDWDFAVAFVLWQGRIRSTFQHGISKQVTQGEFNDIFLTELRKRTQARTLSGKDTAGAKMKHDPDLDKDFIFVRWKGMANELRWAKFGMDIAKVVVSLNNSGAIQYSETQKDDRVPDSWVRLSQDLKWQ